MCNGDSDLVSPTQPADEADDVDFEGIAGQVLILQEDDAEIPDDDGDGGTITFTSGAGNLPFFLNAFWAIDDEEIVLSAGGLMATVDNPSNNDVGQGILSSPVRINPGDSFSVTFESSGAIDGISITPVPIPASALFLLGGLGGLAVLRHRNKDRRNKDWRNKVWRNKEHRKDAPLAV
ncbi:MAG: VPLPA-CTERM sorting domain-containing protein [Pseudomonadota bacterium]